MDLPRRILDGGGGDWERSVLSSASLDQPSAELRARLRQDLGLAVGTGLAAGAMTSKSLGALGAKWTLIGVLIGIVGAAGLASVSGLGRAPTAIEAATPKARSPAASPAPQTPIEPAANTEPAAQATAETVAAVSSASRVPASRPLIGSAPTVDVAE